jgi:malonyl-CoA O-methyltransferase
VFIVNQEKLNKLRIARSFSSAAEGYNAAAVFQQEIGRRLIERLRLVKINIKTVIDLGASTGYCTQLLSEHYVGARIIAVDIAEGMLRYIQKQGDGPPELICGDAQALPFADNTVDLVFSNLMLQWCPDVLSVFKEVQRVLKPGGLLMFATLGPDTLDELRQSWAQVDSYQHANSFADMHDVGDALLGSGLLDPVVDMEYITVTYKKVEKLLHDLRDLGANQIIGNRRLGLLGKGHYQAFVQAYEGMRQEGVLPATYEVIYGHAWKGAEVTEGEASVLIKDIGIRRRG